MITKIFHILNSVLKIRPWLERELTKHFLVAVSVSLCVSVYNTKTQPPILGGLAYPLEKYNTFIMTMVEGRIVKIKPRYI